MPFKIGAGFIGQFKTGDNINHNLRILKLLYRTQANAESAEAKLLCKPIIVTLASIAEAVLHDVFWRMTTHTSEVKPVFAQKILAAVQGKKPQDEFSKYLDAALKHELLGPKTDAIYAQLHELRTWRNRIHIQNAKGLLEDKEKDVFTRKRQQEAELLCEKVVKFIASEYPRPNPGKYVHDLQFPWTAHLP